MLPLQGFEKWINLPLPYKTFAVTACSFTLAALLADVLFRVVESPARNYGKQLLARRKKLSLVIGDEESMAPETAAAI
jgi:peptidoglycan/LPS O-acetylase OafA/YrhL